VRLRYSLVLTFGLWLMLRQVDGVLVHLQGEGHGGYGMNDLGPLVPKDLVERVEDLLAVWAGAGAVADSAFWTYTGLDVLFIVAYLLLIERLVLRTGAPDSVFAWAIVAAVADLAEDVLRGIMFGAGETWDPLVWLAWGATLVKWAALAWVVVRLAVAWHAAGRVAGPGQLTDARLEALWRLRVPLVLLTALGLFLILDPTGQVPDTFRRWFDDAGRFWLSAATTTLAMVLLGFVTWTTARRAVLAHFVVAPRRPSAVLWALALVVLAVGGAAGWTNLFGSVIVIGALFVLEAIASRRGVSGSEAQQQRLAALAAAPDTTLALEVRRVARALAVWPVVALALALVSAWTAPPIVLFAAGHDEDRAAYAVIAVVVCFVVAPVAVRAVMGAVIQQPSGWQPPGRDEVTVLGRSVPWPDKLEIRHLVAVSACAVVCGIAIAWPLDVPPELGVVAMTAIGLAALIAALGEGQRYGETHKPPWGLVMVGFAAIPVTGLLIAAFVVASQFNDGGYHDVARTDRTPSGVELEQVFSGWVARNCADARGDGQTVPMVLIASHGGGIRAAYWTTSVLTDLFGRPGTEVPGKTCADLTTFDRVIALGGASGGSLGVTSYAGQSAGDEEWYRAVWGETDLASVPTSWGLLVDLPRNMIGFDAPDRARRFEQAWERRDSSLDQDFFASQPSTSPQLLLAGTQVESGCRFNISRLRLTPESSKELPGGCAALSERPAVDAAAPYLPGAALTSDLLDYVCSDSGSIRRSSAALMSARFPYVSPSGRLAGCESGRTTAIVDGGYAENTGGQALLNLWARLEPMVAEHNAMAGHARIVPVFVDVDNHYAKAAKAGTVGRTQELLVPPATAGRPDKLDNRGVEQAANATFSTALPGLPEQTCQVGRARTQRFVYIAPPLSPGIEAPLAWTLSDMAMDDLDEQRAAAFADGTPAARLRAILSGTSITCR
jgi:hypothetical protein